MNVYTDSFAEGMRPDPALAVSDWADQFRVLPSKGAAEPGRYRTARAPFLREIMDCLSPSSPVQRVVFMKSSQVGGTEMGLNWLGCVIHMYPAPIMIVQPTIELAERFSKQRVAPMIEETKALRDLIAPSRTRDSGNSILLKEFRGGVVVMAGSNSGVSLRQMPVRFLFCDEVSGYEPDADGEGDPVSLAEKRTQTFGARKKIFLNSTPNIKDLCRIEFEYLRTDQRRYFVPCPHCQAMQWLKWGQLKWEEGQPNTAWYQCENCNGPIEELHKTRMLAAGEWRATSPLSDPLVRGYHISALYSPVGWKSWGECVSEWLTAVEKQRAGDNTFLKAFINSVLGETWDDSVGSKIGADGLQKRAETFDPTVIPARALALTAGVDVQDDRFEVTIQAWTSDEESWVMSHTVIFGDPAQSEIWKQLDDIVLRTWRHESGGEMQIMVTAIDSGHFTHEVYQYARRMKAHRVIAIKGASQRGKPALAKPSKQDVNYKGQVLKSGVELYAVGTDTVKSSLYARYKIEAPGPKYIHFHAALPTNYYEQLVCERRVTRHVKGFPVTEWVKAAGKRNEAFDCLVYCYAALQHLYTKFHRATMWEQLKKRLERSGMKVPEDPKPDPKPEPEKPPEEEPKEPDAPPPEPAPEPEKPPEVKKTDDPGLQLRKQRSSMVRPRRGGYVGRW